MRRVCVFCGANSGLRASYQEAARQVGRAVAERGMELVYGAGNVGLMGVVADAALAAGARVTGVIPEQLVAKELAHQGLTNLHIVKTMHERKAMMADLSDGFVALPGGFGTLEEFCEVLTWAQLGLHGKPCGLLNVDGYYDHLIALFDHALDEKLLRPEHRKLVLASDSVEDLLTAMEKFHSQVEERWLTRTSEV